MSIALTEIKERYFIFHSISEMPELNNDQTIDVINELPEGLRYALQIVDAIQINPPAVVDVIVALNPSKPVETITVAILVVNELLRHSPELIATKPPYSIHPTVQSEIWISLHNLLSHKTPTVRMGAVSTLEVLATTPNPFTNYYMLSMMGRFCTKKHIRLALKIDNDERVKQKMSDALRTIDLVKD